MLIYRYGTFIYQFIYKYNIVIYQFVYIHDIFAYINSFTYTTHLHVSADLQLHTNSFHFLYISEFTHTEHLHVYMYSFHANHLHT